MRTLSQMGGETEGFPKAEGTAPRNRKKSKRGNWKGIVNNFGYGVPSVKKKR